MGESGQSAVIEHFERLLKRPRSPCGPHRDPEVPNLPNFDIRIFQYLLMLRRQVVNKKADDFRNDRGGLYLRSIPRAVPKLPVVPFRGPS